MQKAEGRMQKDSTREALTLFLHSAFLLLPLICLSYSRKWLAEAKLGERRLVASAGKHFRAGTSLPVISRGW
jgi:hypothetical protein